MWWTWQQDSLVLGSQFGVHGVDAGLHGQRGGDAPVVAGEHGDLDADPNTPDGVGPSSETGNLGGRSHVDVAVTRLLPPELLDGAPLVVELLLDALDGSSSARNDLVDLALGEALAAVALELLVDLEVIAAEREGRRLPPLAPGVEARLVAVVRRQVTSS